MGELEKLLASSKRLGWWVDTTLRNGEQFCCKRSWTTKRITKWMAELEANSSWSFNISQWRLLSCLDPINVKTVWPEITRNLSLRYIYLSLSNSKQQFLLICRCFKPKILPNVMWHILDGYQEHRNLAQSIKYRQQETWIIPLVFLDVEKYLSYFHP